MKNSIRFKMCLDSQLGEDIMKKFMDEYDLNAYNEIKFLTPNIDLIMNIIADPLKYVK